MKYAVKIPFAGGKLWITEFVGNTNEVKVTTFDDKILAMEFSRIWGPQAEVLEYDEEGVSIESFK